MHRAAAKGHVDAVRWILLREKSQLSDEAESDFHTFIDFKSTTLRHTALHAACHCGHAEVVQVLLDAGAAHDVPDKWGRTALHHAAAQIRVDVVRLLLSGGASAQTQDKNDRTAVQFAQRAAATATGVSRQRDAGLTAKLLEEAGKKERMWWKAVRGINFSSIRSQLEAVPQLVNMRHWLTNETALHQVCGWTGTPCVPMLELLLEHGADVHAQICSLGKPAHVHWHLPLHKVVRVHVDRCCTIPEAFDFHRRGLDKLEILLAHGAAADAVDSEGCTALVAARKRLELLDLARLGGGAAARAAAQPLFSLLEHAERRVYLRRRWRLVARVAALVVPWHSRAVERAYAPGGLGFAAARAEFEGHAGEQEQEAWQEAEGPRARKSQRVS